MSTTMNEAEKLVAEHGGDFERAWSAAMSAGRWDLVSTIEVMARDARKVG